MAQGPPCPEKGQIQCAGRTAAANGDHVRIQPCYGRYEPKILDYRIRQKVKSCKIQIHYVNAVTQVGGTIYLFRSASIWCGAQTQLHAIANSIKPPLQNRAKSKMEIFIIIGGVFAGWAVLMALIVVIEAYELRYETQKIKRRRLKLKRHYRPFIHQNRRD